MRALDDHFIKFQEGTREAFSHFFLKYHMVIYFYLRKRVDDEAVAQDLTQEAFIVLYNNRHKIAGEEHLRAFLYRTAKICFLNHRRKARAQQAMQEAKAYHLQHELLASEAADALEFERAAAASELHTALQGLSARRRNIIEMRFMHELDVRTIALRLNITEQTVRNTISQSLVFLQERLAGSIRKKNPLFT
ncbi:MAG TPA: sigma-70 family RNA polymerase sigma factor [Puia sp.]|jgi:RNA polymerase sigma factor (sigma-70 family)|nr:sigma-70 family RNA polymerase sigma factor [Puia sp.]